MSVVEHRQLQSEARRVFPRAVLSFADETYTPVPHAWLTRAVWWWHKDRGVAYVPEARDCDDAALEFYLKVTDAVANARVKAAPALGRAVIHGTSPGTRHVVVIAYTEQGWFFYDPTAKGRVCYPLADLKSPVLSLVFGDYNP